MPREQAPRALRTECATAPLGIEVDRPRFGWEPPGTDRQSAYRVLVPTSREALADDRGDARDSGVVESGWSVHVAYDGDDLSPRARYYWKVRVDVGDGLGLWSDVATFETGRPDSAWEAEWIARETDDERAPAPLCRTAFDLEGTVERARATSPSPVPANCG